MTGSEQHRELASMAFDHPCASSKAYNGGSSVYHRTTHGNLATEAISCKNAELQWPTILEDFLQPMTLGYQFKWNRWNQKLDSWSLPT